MTGASTMDGRASPNGLPAMASGGKIRMNLRDAGIVPLLMVLPFMFFPKILEGDTQPWVLGAALIAFVSFRPLTPVKAIDGLLILLSAVCVAVYAARGADSEGLMRASFNQVLFSILLLVCRRARGDFFSSAVKATIVIWLAVAVYQYIAIVFGLPVQMFGRFVEGRSGVPSLTPEPAMLGGLAIIHVMFLLGENNPKNTPYIMAASVTAVLSGSLLALILFVFPILRLRMSLRIVALMAVPLVIAADYLLSSSGIVSRLTSLDSGRAGIEGLLIDPSLNLRVGHLYFTLYETLVESLALRAPIDFMWHYNLFASGTHLYIPTGSNFILSTAGDLIYTAGGAGLALMAAFIGAAMSSTATGWGKIQKGAFVAACLLNPIAMSNAFLVIYAVQRDDKR